MTMCRNRTLILLLLFGSAAMTACGAEELYLSSRAVAGGDFVTLADLTDGGRLSPGETDIPITRNDGHAILSVGFIRTALLSTRYADAIIVGGPVAVASSFRDEGDAERVFTILEYLSENIIEEGGKLEVELGGAAVKTISEGGTGFRRMSSTLSPNGLLAVYLYPERGNGALPYRIDVRRIYHAPFAGRDIDAGREINLDDVEFRETVVPQGSRKGLDLQGRRYTAGTSIRPGEMITAGMVRPAYDIRTGDEVSVRITRGALTVVMTAVAAGSGAIGDMVAVRIAATGKRIEAAVIGKGEVSLHAY